MVAAIVVMAAIITVVMILAAATADMVTVAVMLITEGYRGKCKRSRCHEPDTGYDCPLPHPVTSSSA